MRKTRAQAARKSATLAERLNLSFPIVNWVCQEQATDSGHVTPFFDLSCALGGFGFGKRDCCVRQSTACLNQHAKLSSLVALSLLFSIE